MNKLLCAALHQVSVVAARFIVFYNHSLHNIHIIGKGMQILHSTIINLQRSEYTWMLLSQPMWHSLLCKICDDDDGEANNGEYSTNVGHPSEGKGICVQLGVGANVLQRGDSLK